MIDQDHMWLVMALLLCCVLPGGARAERDTERAGALTHEWVILDSGGSGGGFGKGDVRKNLNDVCFWDDRVGVACGDRGVYRTQNGGLTWQTLPLKVARVGWRTIRLAGPKDIWVGGQIHPGGPGKGFLFHSEDAGQTWQRVLAGRLEGASRLGLTPMGDIWVMTRRAASFHSPDGGRTWQKVDFGLPVDAVDICFPGDVPYATEYVGYVLGYLGNESVVLKSTNSGKTWQRLSLPSDVGYLRRLFFTTSREGWVGGNDGRLLYTSDGGLHWQSRDLPARGQSLCALWFYRTGEGWVAMQQPFDGIGKLIFDHTLFFTPDGGRTWRPEMSGWKSAQGLWSNGPGTCWVVGNVPGFVPNDLVAILSR